jgi:hypothetical protein
MMYAFIVTILGVFLGEHFGRLYDFTYRPSFYLWLIANKAQYFWELGGRVFAIVSSFIHRLELEEMFLTVRIIGEPIFRIVSSPIYFLKAYSKEMETYKFPILIGLGSIILVIFGNYAYVHLLMRRPVMGRPVKKSKKVKKKVKKNEEGDISSPYEDIGENINSYT